MSHNHDHVCVFVWESVPATHKGGRDKTLIIITHEWLWADALRGTNANPSTAHNGLGEWISLLQQTKRNINRKSNGAVLGYQEHTHIERAPNEMKFCSLCLVWNWSLEEKQNKTLQGRFFSLVCPEPTISSFGSADRKEGRDLRVVCTCYMCLLCVCPSVCLSSVCMPACGDQWLYWRYHESPARRLLQI